MTGIPDDEAVDAYAFAEAECPGFVLDGVPYSHDERCCTRAGLAAALPHLAGAIRADVAEEIATAIEQANDAGAWVGVVPHEPAILAYDHAAALARLLRVPDCGDQYHGADGGPCSRCGFDAAGDVQDPVSGAHPPNPTNPPPNVATRPRQGP